MTENETTEQHSPPQNRQGYSEEARALAGYFQEAEVELEAEILRRENSMHLDPRGRVLTLPASSSPETTPPSSPPLVGLSGSGPLPSESSNVSQAATPTPSTSGGSPTVSSNFGSDGSTTSASPAPNGLTLSPTQQPLTEPTDTATAGGSGIANRKERS